jgi:CelD/BcsL family acetyltransferase involved in cellulose biosynthesis
VKAEVVTGMARLEEYESGWDALAVACRRPRAAPAWTLAWFRHGLPAGALIRTVIVSDGAVVVGTAPFFVTRTGAGFYHYSPAAPILNGVVPLSWPGRDEEVGEAIGAALAASKPTPDLVSIGWMPAASGVPGAIRRGWRRPQPALIDEHQFPVPRVVLGGRDFDAWLGGRSKSFRSSLRAYQRKLIAEGFEHRMSSEPADILERLPHQQRLYESRRVDRGGTGTVFDETFMEIARDAVTRSAPGRVRLGTIEREGEVIATDLILGSGGEAVLWLRGFEEEWAHLSPGRANLAWCVEDCIAMGDDVFDLGPGLESYKASFTSDEVVLQGRLLSRRGLWPLHTPAQLVPFGTRRAAARIIGRLRGPR